MDINPMMLTVLGAGFLSVFVLPWPPTYLGVLALVLLGVGFVMILIAKMSTPYRWRLFVFGPAGMSTRMRRLYFWGYALIGVGAVIVFLFRWIMSTVSRLPSESPIP